MFVLRVSEPSKECKLHISTKEIMVYRGEFAHLHPSKFIVGIFIQQN
jgi:hypothetical protein